MRRMNIRDFLSTLTPEQREAFATRAGTKASYFPQLMMDDHRKPSVKLARRLVDASDGALTLEELRPDVWGDTQAA